MPEAKDNATVVKSLVDDFTANTQSAVKEFNEVKRIHIALAKAEVGEKLTKPIGVGVALLAVAGVLALDALMLLFVTGGLGLYAAGLPPWAAFGIVVLVLFLITGILAAVGVKSLKKAGPPERSIAAAKQLVDRVKTTVKG